MAYPPFGAVLNAPRFQAFCFRSAMLLYVLILVLGSIPGARHEIGAFATGAVLHSLAYAGLSTASKEKYKSPLRFATSMRLNFWALYNHQSYRFLARSGDSQTEIQKVEVRGDDRVPHVFLFRMIKAENGTWLIDDVLMLENDGQPI